MKYELILDLNVYFSLNIRYVFNISRRLDLIKDQWGFDTCAVCVYILLTGIQLN